MKKNFFVLVSAFLLLNLLSCRTAGEPQDNSKNSLDEAVVDISHNSRNSLDWAGVYAGVIPAADAEGINVEVTLNNDETYKVTYQYIGISDEVFIHTGTFKWNDEGSTVILDSTELPPYYKVGENILIQLDMEGNVIDGMLADNYILKKQG